MKIITLKAKEILDSKGKGTVEVSMETSAGVVVASVPSGVSKGEFEALEIPSLEAINNIKEFIYPEICDKDFTSQEEFDKVILGLDGTENKSRLGANALLAVSMVFCRSLAKSKKLPLWREIADISGNSPKLPSPMLLCLEGGRHGESGLSVQEFMVAGRSKSFIENFEQGKKVYENLRLILANQTNCPLSLGLEGGFASPVHKTETALSFLNEAIEKAGLSGEIGIALDVAASEFFENENYNFEGESWLRKNLIDFYKNILSKYPIISLEDPFAKTDAEGWQELMQLLIINNQLLIVGDDLTATNPKIIREAEDKKLCNGVIIKLNQIGTVSETITAVSLAKSFGWKIIVSHRGGETMDDFIADLAVGVAADFIKTGGPTKPERKAKYDRLLSIEKELQS